MGGVADRPQDADVELVYRAAQERRLILLSRSVMVDCDGSPARPEVARPPSYSPREGTLRHHAIGFPAVTVACDVVLPFHGLLDYVRESLTSVLEQDGAEVIVHLIDDASPCPTESFLREWARHPRVRTYRNLENIGPYSSFNNVLPFLTTGLVAVQDGDDISLPGRIHQAGNTLRLADAEIFGGRTRPFGALALLGPSATRAGGVKTVARAPYRSSRVPPRQPLGHLLEHPTAVYRTDAFERLGGFSDFGRTDRNCCSLDTEFYLRAAYAGARFAVSNHVALLYRCHAESATQNALTGWGSVPRLWTLRECRRRAHRFQIKPFDPSAFSGLGRYTGLTRQFP
jgi:glycosyltransferase involved in cell wall biosynthesis